MNPLETLIRAEIAERGAMGIDRYMEMCLSHPEHGYYMTRDPFGVSGDFTTAPEISQMFGELVGLWLAQSWLDAGSPAPFNLVELGPGRGTLMADILRVGRSVPGFLEAAKLCLMETSPILREMQAITLTNCEPNWIDDLDRLNDAPLLLIANEFFDALPVRQFQKVGDLWLERVVQDQDGLKFGLSKTDRKGFPQDLPDGAIVERAYVGADIVRSISKIVAEQGGAALIFDYGDASGSGDTLQAVKSHTSVSVLEAPGTADVTAHVNFGDLARNIGDCAGFLTTQGQFLTGMGITERAEALLKNAEEEVAAALHRLTDAGEMGTLFKAMAITKAGATTPHGF